MPLWNLNGYCNDRHSIDPISADVSVLKIRVIDRESTDTRQNAADMSVDTRPTLDRPSMICRPLAYKCFHNDTWPQSPTSPSKRKAHCIGVRIPVKYNLKGGVLTSVTSVVSETCPLADRDLASVMSRTWVFTGGPRMVFSVTYIRDVWSGLPKGPKYPEQSVEYFDHVA